VLLGAIFSMKAFWYTLATAFLSIFIPAAGIGRLLGIWDIEACVCWAVRFRFSLFFFFF
jgi:hypothetical protein